MLSKIKELKPYLKEPKTLFFINLGGSALATLILIILLSFVLGGKPKKIKRLNREIKQLQEKLISAQITSKNLNHVQNLIDNNLAYSSKDTLAQGASLTFLKDLTAVFDKLKINLVSLQPEKIIKKRYYVEIPYKMDIVCNFHQFVQLLNKMEKSPRLISIKSFNIDNSFEDYFSEKKGKLDQCQVSIVISTLTLIKKH